MKYYFDTECLEGTQKENFPINLFRKNTPPTIDLISIGIVAEDGRELYAISKDFNLKEAWNRFDLAEQTMFEKQNGFKGRKIYWLRENVLKPIYEELCLIDMRKLCYENNPINFSYLNLKKLIQKHGKTNLQIAEKIKSFTTQYSENNNEIWDKPEFYAYYADYDWVVFCWLFGKMMDLPKGFPMYCRDLKQMLDEHFVINNEVIDYCVAVNECDNSCPTNRNLNKTGISFGVIGIFVALTVIVYSGVIVGKK